MTTLTKSLWIIGIVNTVAGLVFVTGLVDVSQASGLYVTFPLGVIFLGFAGLSKMMEKEVAVYDQEHRAQPAPKRLKQPTPGSAGSQVTEEQRQEAPVRASDHPVPGISASK
jgi:hypothetical protein